MRGHAAAAGTYVLRAKTLHNCIDSLGLRPLLAVAVLGFGLASDALAAPDHVAAPLGPQMTAVIRHTGGICGPVAMQPVAARPAANKPAGASPLSPRIVRALCVASLKTQADPFLLLAIAWQESRFDPAARNRFSSARGLLQFTTTTWLTVIRDYGARYGLGNFASAIRTDRDGRIWVTSRTLRKQILALRDSPEIEAIMAAEWLNQQKDALERQVGRPATPADLYLLHLLGPSGAKDFLTILSHTPSVPSLDVVGKVAERNLSLFVRDGRKLTVTQTYQDIRASLNEQVELHASLFSPAG